MNEYKIDQKLYTFKYKDRHLERKGEYYYSDSCDCCGYSMEEFTITDVNEKFQDVLVEGISDSIFFTLINKMNPDGSLSYYTTKKGARKALAVYLKNNNEDALRSISSYRIIIAQNKKLITQISESLDY